MLENEPAPTTRILSGLLDEVASGSSAVLTVRGPSGQGKSGLLDRTAATARERGFTVLRATGVPFERDLAFAGLSAVLRPLLRRIDELPGVQAEALRAALGFDAAAAAVAPLATHAATLGLLTLADHPIVVIVDDAHWIDQSSLESLVYAARRGDAEPMGFVFAHRPDVPCLLDQARFPVVELGELPVAEQRLAILRGRLGGLLGEPTYGAVDGPTTTGEGDLTVAAAAMLCAYAELLHDDFVAAMELVQRVVDRSDPAGVVGRAVARLDAQTCQARTSGPKPPEDGSLASRLTRAELRVARSVGHGASNREAADELFISVKTVDYHLRGIYRKLGLRNRSQLAALVAADERAGTGVNNRHIRR